VKLQPREPSCDFRLKTGRGGGQVAEEHHQQEGLAAGGTASPLGIRGVGGLAPSGRAEELFWVTWPCFRLLESSSCCPLQCPRPCLGLWGWSQCFLEKDGSVGSGAGLGYLIGFLGFHERLQKLVSLERDFFLLTKGGF